MKCPICGNELDKGIIEITDGSHLFNSSAFVTWYPNENEHNNKKFLKNLFRKGISLSRKAEAYYCDECMKIFACFDEK